MSRKSKISLPVLIDSEVVRQIRQHARSENKIEVCGVLIGREAGAGIEIATCIPGVNAAQGGAHVTFTQDTWEHIYKIKDKQYPEERILGWYHSHPGFGVFLSDHDTFIHKNFFSSPQQIAWVYDPHSDEEGCFGWLDGRIVRLTRIDVVDRRGGEQADITKPEPLDSAAGGDDHRPITSRAQRLTRDDSGEDSLLRLATTILSHLSVLALGFAISYFLFPPRLLMMAIPVDPRTGVPLGPAVEVPEKTARELLRDNTRDDDKATTPKPPETSNNPAKEKDAQH